MKSSIWLKTLTEIFISAIPQNYRESKNGEKYSALENHAISLLSYIEPNLYDDNYLRLVSLIAEGAYQPKLPVNLTRLQNNLGFKPLTAYWHRYGTRLT